MEQHEEWGRLLAGWAIPSAVVDAAPEPPYFFPADVFIAAADDALARRADTVSDAVARDALGEEGTVLDVGAGAGAASLRLRPAEVTAVDASTELLDAFADRADRIGLSHREVHGTWPGVSPSVGAADVVVCHHVVYNVGDLAAFAQALTGHARRRVVVELTAVHPMRWLAPYWEALHGLAQPERPTAEDAVDTLRALGLDVHEERWARRVEMIGELGPGRLARIARRLCLPAERHPDLARLLDDVPPPEERDVVTLWWSA